MSPRPANTFSFLYKATSLRYFILAATKMQTVSTPYLSGWCPTCHSHQTPCSLLNSCRSHPLPAGFWLCCLFVCFPVFPFLFVILLVLRFRIPKLSMAGASVFHIELQGLESTFFFPMLTIEFRAWKVTHVETLFPASKNRHGPLQSQPETKVRISTIHITHLYQQRGNPLSLLSRGCTGCTEQ